MTGASAIMRIEAVLRTVPALDEAARFYRTALGFEPVRPAATLAATDRDLLGLAPSDVRLLPMRAGRQQVWFIEVSPGGRPYPADSTATDLWFQHCALVVGDVATIARRALEAGATPISEGGPQTLPANTGGVTAFKFRDPVGHPLEFLSFPVGVGAPIWHVPDPAPLRGIDHTAIAVSDMERSRRFYADVLGLTVGETTHNRGAEQARLDAVPADEVDVMALQPAAAPPHLELLAYRTGLRRHLPAPAPADIAVSRTVAAVDMEALVERLREAAHPFRFGTFDGRAAVTFDDPDGHQWICRAD